MKIMLQNHAHYFWWYCVSKERKVYKSRQVLGSPDHVIKHKGFIKGGEFHDQLDDCQLLKKVVTPRLTI
jgi:hypothetical protein